MHIHCKALYMHCFFTGNLMEIFAKGGKITDSLDIYDFFVYNSKWYIFEFMHFSAQLIKIMTEGSTIICEQISS